MVLASSVSELVKKFLNRAVDVDTRDRSLRDELRIEIDRVRNELVRTKQELVDTEKSLDEWKLKYFDLLQQNPRQ